ncbi:phage integrase family protein [Desulfobotulus alkaliphilus]|uniref:Phage integrase family protein n=2 Tax=Desulfobotulus alkaliphilus TaxID=622671 RepID=A0A562S0Z1_9BACT|nr:phage integrase family protein [Desulfobotulus alkaliphilus]
MLRKKKSRRDLALFECGLSWGLRGGDLLALDVGDVRGIEAGQSFSVTEKKTRKERRITINNHIRKLLDEFLSERPDASDDTPLFSGQRGRMSTSWLCRLITGWCRAVGLNELNYGSHSLRKSAGYHRRLAGFSLPVLCQWYGHSSEALTLKYLGIQPQEIAKLYEYEF